jgi:hypothetical protein
MNKNLKKLICAGGSAILIFGVTSCSSGNSSSITTLPTDNAELEPTLANVSKAEFDTALKNVDVTVDEFKGNYEIFGKGDPNITVGSNVMSLTLALSREKSNSEWRTNFVSGYAGADWMFHDEWNLKSTKGILSVNIDSSIRDDQAESGYVTELAIYPANDDEVAMFCEVTSGSEVRFRLRGSRGSVKEVTGDMSRSAINEARDICAIYSGLKQGFTVSNLP